MTDSYWKLFCDSPLIVGSAGVMVMTPDWESVGCEFDTGIFSFLKEKPGLIRLISNTKSEKTRMFEFWFRLRAFNSTKVFLLHWTGCKFLHFSL